MLGQKGRGRRFSPDESLKAGCRNGVDLLEGGDDVGAVEGALVLGEAGDARERAQGGQGGGPRARERLDGGALEDAVLAAAVARAQHIRQLLQRRARRLPRRHLLLQPAPRPTAISRLCKHCAHS